MKLVGIHLNDIHLDGKGPVSRLDDWPETVFGKLDQVLTVVKATQAVYVAIAGDIFHHKAKVSYGIVRRLMEWCYAVQQAGATVVAIPGNHDEQYDRLESIPNQPLGLLFAAGAMHDASRLPAVIPRGGIRLVGVGYPLATTVDGLHQVLDEELHTEGIMVVLAHCFAGPSGGTYFGEAVHDYRELQETFPHVRVWHFGHEHADHGVTQIGQTWFVNIGALTRGSIALEDVERTPKLALATYLWPDEGGACEVSVQQVRLKVAPASEVFDLKLKTQKDAEAERIEQFVSDLTAGLLELGPVNVRERVAKIDLPDTVRQRVLAYIEAAERGTV